MKSIQLTGIGNGIVDLLVSVDDSFLAEHDIAKGSMELVSNEEQARLLSLIDNNAAKLSCGGSVCNSIVTFAALGGKAGMLTSIGSDDLTNHYLDELGRYDIKYSDLAINPDSSIGTSLVMITPDGERSMRTCLAASGKLSAEHIDHEMIKDSEWLFLEGYLLAAPDALAALPAAIETAKASRTKVALTLSAESIVRGFKANFLNLLGSVDLLFANQSEAQAITDIDSAKDAAEHLAKTVPHVVVTASSDGAHIINAGEYTEVSALKCTPVDVTGAGDTYAAGILYGALNELSDDISGNLATKLSTKVITQVGARIKDLEAIGPDSELLS